ncbi:MAG: helix-turn-helix domain-containing protein [Rubrobacteraceae bacterium]
MSDDSLDISVGISGLNPLEGSSRMKDLLRAYTAISRALNLAQPLPRTLDLIAEKVSQTMDHKYCAVLLANENSELLIEGSFGLSEEYARALNTDLKQRIAGDGVMSRSVTAQAYRTQMPVYVADITADPRFKPWREVALKAGYKSIVALPLVFREEIIGVLNCYDEPRSYTEDQVEALMVVAEQAASAVGITRLIEAQRSTIEELNSLNQHVVSQHDRLQRSEKTHDALTTLLLEDRPLDDITATISNLLCAPVVLQDEQFRVLSQAVPTDGYLTVSSLNSHGLRDIRELLPELREAGRAKSLNQEKENPNNGELVVAPLDLGGHERGYLTVPLEDEAERDFFLRTLEQAATIYTLYMVKQRVAQETEDRVKGDLLVDLLAARYRDAAEVRERAHYLGIDFRHGPFRIFVARHGSLSGYLEKNFSNPRSVGYARSKLLALARNLTVGSESGMVGAEGDHLISLVPGSDNDPHRMAENLLENIRKEFPGLPVCVGVSAPCEDPKDFAPHYEEIRSLLKFAESLGACEKPIHYDEWKVYGLLLRSAERKDVLDLSHRVLRPLLAQDHNGQGELLPTLQAYIDNNLSPSRTAKALYVHPNTVKYRIKRISELLDLDLDDLDNVLTVKVALTIQSLQPTIISPENDHEEGSTDRPAPGNALQKPQH